ncbi:hypothetical protein BC936DRAFT_147974 [Jimgerdemannia flammicorona]|uniref:Signal recognition particle, SRP19 subunit n=1 Tax=Jimgerdemannia flammicorona TaxID=994334 RepID=A0A433D420_9FUNG|nr:hypothetical protein BC936DRAFT_147974 [Jimgerdemannia flammicorona]
MHPMVAFPFFVSRRWVCLYPCYIDVDKSIEEGRKISKSLAVKNPHGFRIAHVVQSLGLSVVYESHKTHPRDWSNPGRVRVEMKRNSMYVNPAIKTRKQLLHRVAALLPGLEKTLEIPKQLISPLTPLSEIQSIADEMRRVQLGGAGAASSPPRVTSGPSSPSASSSVATPEASASKKKGKKGRK